MDSIPSTTTRRTSEPWCTGAWVSGSEGTRHGNRRTGAPGPVFLHASVREHQVLVTLRSAGCGVERPGVTSAGPARADRTVARGLAPARSRVRRRRRLRRPRQRRHEHGRGCDVRVPAALGARRGDPDGGARAVPVGEGRLAHRPLTARAGGRSQPDVGAPDVLGAGRGRRRRHRPRRDRRRRRSRSTSSSGCRSSSAPSSPPW